MSQPAVIISMRRERLLLWLLAGLQFTHLLDFMVLTPLAPQFMRLWGIAAHEFGYLVAVYAVAAALAGLGATFFIDRFDRRRSLTLVYAIFVLSTLACALATGFWSLLAARALAGASGGVVGSVVLAIAGDVIPAQRRGRAMGVIMSAFPLVSVLGVPASLLLATRFGWHAPFFTLAAIGLVLWFGIGVIIPRIDAHLGGVAERTRGWLRDFLALFMISSHRRALASVFAFTLSGFAIFPYLSAYQVKNVGVSEADLAWVFFAGGVATIFTSRMIGWSADRFGKRRMFLILAASSLVPMIIMTHLPRSGLPLLLVVSTLFMVLMSGRFIPLMALVTTCVDPRVRGAFMSLSSAAQNLAAGLASLGSGALIGHAADGSLTGFGTVGYCAAGLTVACVLIARRLQPVASVGQPGKTVPA
jgi:predicted MFS family arabinose efflux permease